MATYYYLYTEIKVDGKWYCINNKLKNIDKEKYGLSTTYWSGSYSYFGETYDKLEAIGKSINKIELSDELKEKYGTEKEQYETFPLTVDWEYIKGCIPSEKLYEYHGYVHKNTVASYRLGEQDDIYDCIDIDEYKKLSFEEQKLYKYFEWDDSQGWFKYFKEIIEHVSWQLYEWKDVNMFKTIDDVRIIVFRF